MKTIYIQYATDFHLLAALAAIENIGASKVIIIGPLTALSALVTERLMAQQIAADPRSPKISIWGNIKSWFRAKTEKEIVIISPFVFPTYSFIFLLREGVRVKKFIRTDEGVGTYASVWHYYVAYRVESRKRSSVDCMLKAVTKKSSMYFTGLTGLCDERYIFNRDLSVNYEQVGRLKNNVNLMGKDGSINDRTVFVSQPGLADSFDSVGAYIDFIKRVCLSKGGKDVVVKRHPRDEIKYGEFGFEVIEGLPLELYELKRATVVGFTSTALLTAKIIGGCAHVYFIKRPGRGISYDGLSVMNKKLFNLYLESIG